MRIHSLMTLLLTLLVAPPALAALAGNGEECGAGPRAFSSEIDYIEGLRGLEFPAEIDHRTIRRDQLEVFLRKIWARDLAIPESEYLDVLVALHLIDPDAEEPFESLLDLYVSQVLAFYDPVDDVFYTIEDEPGSSLGTLTAEFERAVTVHELVHVLQDQRFNAGDTLLKLADDWDRSLAYHALIEGEATLVMLAVLVEDMGGSIDEALEDDQIARVLGEAAGLDLSSGNTPPYFVESMKFPYVDGLTYVINLYREGGWKAVEAAHRDPPDSTEAIYDGWGGRAIEPLDIDGALIETTLGEFHWRFLLGKECADGWEADRVAVVPAGDDLAIVAVTEWDTPENAQHFAEAYSSFLTAAGSRPAIRITGVRVEVAYGPDGISEELLRRVAERDDRRDGERSTPR